MRHFNEPNSKKTEPCTLIVKANVEVSKGKPEPLGIGRKGLIPPRPVLIYRLPSGPIRRAMSRRLIRTLVGIDAS